MIIRLLQKLRWAAIAVQEHSSWASTWSNYLKGKVPAVIKVRNGLTIEAPPENNLDLIVHEIFYREVYSPPFLRVEKGDVVVDIGANVGTFSIFSSLKEASKVISFEPFPDNFSCIKKNIEVNGIKNIEPRQAAVTDKEGTVKLYVSDVSGGHLLFDHNVNGALENFIEVNAFTLPGIMDEFGLGVVDFLKIDCEGSEGAILRSTPSAYLKRIRKIAIEFHDNVSDPKHDGIIRLLEDAGFKTWLDWNGKSDFGYIYALNKYEQ